MIATRTIRLTPTTRGKYDITYNTWRPLKCILTHQVNGYCSIDQLYRHVGLSKGTCRHYALQLHEKGFLVSGTRSILELTPYARTIDALVIRDLPEAEAGSFTVPDSAPCYEYGLSYWLQFVDKADDGVIRD